MERSAVNLVLLTGDGPEHRYVANRLDREIGLTAVIVDAGVRLSAAERRAQLRRRYSRTQLVGRGALRLGLRLIGDEAARQDQFDEVLGTDSRRWAVRPEVQRVRGINGDRARAAIEAAEPDRLLVYGTGIVGPRALGLGRATPLNMHTGWSPDYRGCDCAFWPLYDRSLDRLGATVHEVTADVDGGRIYGRTGVELASTDRIHSVFARCVKAGTDLYVGVLSGLADGAQGDAFVQDLSRGREYRAADRNLRAEIRVRWAIRRGLVEEFCRSPGPSSP